MASTAKKEKDEEKLSSGTFIPFLLFYVTKEELYVSVDFNNFFHSPVTEQVK